MQMSRERFQAVHKLIWNTVISHASEVRDKKASVHFLKKVGIETAFEKGMLDFDESLLIMHRNQCLICASSDYCENCPLGDCDLHSSVYKKACRGDMDAMIEIRDVVDKDPYTKLSVVTLHDWGYK